MSLYPACHEIISGCVIYKVLSKDLPRLTLYKIKWKKNCSMVAIVGPYTYGVPFVSNNKNLP